MLCPCFCPLANIDHKFFSLPPSPPLPSPPSPFSGGRHKEAEQWCSLSMEFLEHLTTFKDSYQQQVRRVHAVSSRECMSVHGGYSPSCGERMGCWLSTLHSTAGMHWCLLSWTSWPPCWVKTHLLSKFTAFFFLFFHPPPPPPPFSVFFFTLPMHVSDVLSVL